MDCDFSEKCIASCQSISQLEKIHDLLWVNATPNQRNFIALLIDKQYEKLIKKTYWNELL